MKQRKRNLTLAGYDIQVSAYDDTIAIKFRAGAGSVEYSCSKILDPHLAVHLIRELRRGLRKIRDEKSAMLARCVENAEGTL